MLASTWRVRQWDISYTEKPLSRDLALGILLDAPNTLVNTMLIIHGDKHAALVSLVF